jgi:hypothetical protein
MANVPEQDISTLQAYTGMPPFQYNNHVAGIPKDLRSNFYENL